MADHPPPGEPTAAQFRQVMGHFATGVTVVTATDTTPTGTAPLGLAVNSFTSVSLDPPLVALCVRLASTTWPRVRSVGTFCVNLLAHDQEAVCRTFSEPGADRFAAIGWHPSPAGAPVLDDVLAFVDCTIEVEHPAGDHVLVVGRVTDMGVLREDRPLVFYRGGYGRFEP